MAINNLTVPLLFQPGHPNCTEVLLSGMYVKAQSSTQKFRFFENRLRRLLVPQVPVPPAPGILVKSHESNETLPLSPTAQGPTRFLPCRLKKVILLCFSCTHLVSSAVGFGRNYSDKLVSPAHNLGFCYNFLSRLLSIFESRASYILWLPKAK